MLYEYIMFIFNFRDVNSPAKVRICVSPFWLCEKEPIFKSIWIEIRRAPLWPRKSPIAIADPEWN